MILLRDRAEAEGAAFLRVALTPPDKVAALIAAAGPEEAALLRGAAAERDRLLTDNPAGFARRNPLVADAHAAWQAAEASGDAAAAEAAAQTYAEASLAEQRRLGLPATERRLLTPAGATALLAEFNATDRPDPAALGDRLRGWFGDRWVGVLQQLEEVGLPASLAEIAAMDRADQRAARRRLADLIGTPTAELRTAIGEDGAGVVDQRLRNALVARTRRGLPTFGGPTDAGMENVRRLSYALVDSGEAPRAAADEAATRVWKEVEGVPELIHVRDDFGLRFVGPGVGPYTGEKAREIEELLGAITSAAEDDLDEMIERINLVFGDMPEFAAVVAGYTRLALGAVGRPSMPRENAREALGLFRDLMLTDQIPGGWDYREFPQQGRLAAFESSMRDLVASYQHDYPLAAEYLERFLDGTGGTVELEVDYLRSQPDMAPGEERNRRRFKEWFLGQLDTIDPSEAIHEELNAMSDGDTLTRGTPWVTVISASLSDLEYYLAIRGSNLESNGDFVFNRVGDTILVEGTVVHVWTDEYDWTAGESVRLPSSDDPLRVVSQDDMLALRDFGGAADFHVRPTENWEQDVTGTLTVRDGKVVEADLTWGEMRLVPRSGMANQSP
ncbi:MAG: hypothetical protein HKM95_10430 [Inquilinus sp.]|nr:hypothetical protein [Inquilinus sp.]